MIINASEARKISSGKQIHLDCIFDLITDAATTGIYAIFIEHTNIDKYKIKALKDLGYNVEKTNDQIIIDWNPET